MLGIGDKAPAMKVAVQQGVETLPGGETIDLGARDGRWKVLFFWPRNFTSVCPTDVISYCDIMGALNERNTDLIGASTDSVHMHLAWRKSDPRLAACEFPWIADESGALAKAFDIYDAAENQARRVTYIIDPDGVIQHVTANALLVGRNTHETVRVLEALQSGDHVPCNWQPGEPVLNPA